MRTSQLCTNGQLVELYVGAKYSGAEMHNISSNVSGAEVEGSDMHIVSKRVRYALSFQLGSENVKNTEYLRASLDCMIERIEKT